MDERKADGVCFHHMTHRENKVNRRGGNMQEGRRKHGRTKIFCNCAISQTARLNGEFSP